MAVVALLGEHDLSTAAVVRDALQDASSAPAGVVVDLSHTSFIDSSILGLIITAYREAGESDRGFALAVGNGCGTAVRRVLELTDLRSTVTVRDDLASAVAICRSRAVSEEPA